MSSLRPQPHIAVVQRESLRWLPAPAAESVDVFSIELGKYFMDLRIYKQGERKGQVDWAMGGVRQVLDGSTEALTKLRFLNIIDYRDLHTSPSPALPSDLINPEERTSPLDTTTPDDVTIQPISPTHYLESGRMPNPDTSSDEYVPFEEVWRRVPVGPNEDAFLLESLGGDGQGKAYLGQVGCYRMGLIDTGRGSFHGWRKEKVGSEWQTVRQTHEDSRKVLEAVPEDVVARAKEGEILSWAGREWVIRVKTQT